MGTTTTMKTFLKALTFIGLAFSAPAFAADMSVKAPPAPVAPAFSWTGFYLGVEGGGAWGGSDPTTTTVFSPTGYFATSSVPAIANAGRQHISSHGGTFGGELGYNWQSGFAVFGVETDFSWFRLDGSTGSGAVYPCCAPTAFGIGSSVQTDWLFTFRPRVGVASDHWMLYATGGVAVTNVKAAFAFVDTFATAAESASISTTKTGWVVGVGGEYAFAQSWSVKV
jgi:outer membrane immunogenic protein